MRPLLALALMTAAAASPDAREQLLPVDETAYRKVVAANKGRVILVDLWATWCAPCLEEMPLLVKLAAKYRGKGFQLITISCDEPEDEKSALQFLRKQGAPLPGYLKKADNDEEFINSVDPKWSGALPALFLYDRGGRLVRSFVGEADMAEVERAIVKLL